MRISNNIALSQKTRNELKFLQQAMNKGYLKSSPKTRKSYKYLQVKQRGKVTRHKLLSISLTTPKCLNNEKLLP